MSPRVFSRRRQDGLFAEACEYRTGARWITDRLQAKIEASKILADDRELSEPVLGIAPLGFDASVRYVAPSRRAWVEFGGRNVWEQRLVSAARLEAPSPGFTLHRFRVGVELRRPASWHASATNLGDTFHSEHLNSLNRFIRQRVLEMVRALTTA